MKPIALLDPTPVRAVLVDIDDTLTTEGKLTAHAYASLERLHAAGLKVVPVTGRPAGWCDHIARMWPVDAVVGENGAFYFIHADGRLQKRFSDDAATRAGKRARLEAIAKRIFEAVPGCALASDQAYRETDLAIDYREDVQDLGLAAAERIAALMRAAGLTARALSQLGPAAARIVGATSIVPASVVSSRRGWARWPAAARRPPGRAWPSNCRSRPRRRCCSMA